MAIVMIAPYLPGSSSEAFKGVNIITGAFLSLGSASAFLQITARLTLMFACIFKPGDFVKIGEIERVGIPVSAGDLHGRGRSWWRPQP